MPRKKELIFGDRELPLPVFFPSISSVKTVLSPVDYLQVLSSLAGLNKQFLVSAFDLGNIDQPLGAQAILRSARQAGVVTLMDSGNYESFWKSAQGNWHQADFHRVLSSFSVDLAFGFDEQVPPSDHREHVALVEARWRADQAAAGRCRVIPIIHGAARELPGLCRGIAEATGVEMLAVPERRLGDGVLERMRSVKAIRDALSDLGRYVVLHLLGTGNPVSIAMYSSVGADSFDGLEWCQTVVDHETGGLYHLSQADFFFGQTAWGSEPQLSFQARVLAHNIVFFNDWMGRLHNALVDERLQGFCRANLSSRAFCLLSQVAGWE